jgi:hypothetical protein
LVSELGGIRNVRKAELDTLQELTWLPDTVAEAVYAKTHGLNGGRSRSR